MACRRHVHHLPRHPAAGEIAAPTPPAVVPRRERACRKNLHRLVRFPTSTLIRTGRPRPPSRRSSDSLASAFFAPVFFAAFFLVVAFLRRRFVAIHKLERARQHLHPQSVRGRTTGSTFPPVMSAATTDGIFLNGDTIVGAVAQVCPVVPIDAPTDSGHVRCGSLAIGRPTPDDETFGTGADPTALPRHAMLSDLGRSPAPPDRCGQSRVPVPGPPPSDRRGRGLAGTGFDPLRHASRVRRSRPHRRHRSLRHTRPLRRLDDGLTRRALLGGLLVAWLEFLLRTGGPRERFVAGRYSSSSS